MKALGKIVDVIMLVMIFLVIVVGFGKQIIVGGVVVDQKIDSDYMLMLRESKGIWHKTSALGYDAHVIYPWLLFSTVSFVGFVTFLRKDKG